MGEVLPLPLPHPLPLPLPLPHFLFPFLLPPFHYPRMNQPILLYFFYFVFDSFLLLLPLQFFPLLLIPLPPRYSHFYLYCFFCQSFSNHPFSSFLWIVWMVFFLSLFQLFSLFHLVFLLQLPLHFLP